VGERQQANNTDGVRERVTIRDAATLLGVHPNTVRNRIKTGMYRAEKVHTERGETWMIDRDSLTTNTLTKASQQIVGRVPPEALTALAREIVKEAGIQQNPEQRRSEEYLKANIEVTKHIVTLAGGVALAAVALHTALDLWIWGTVGSLVAVAISFVTGLFVLFGAVIRSGWENLTVDELRWAERGTGWAIIFLVMGVLTFVVLAFLIGLVRI
jgi:hypothetical protein